jgi:quinol monooxygenase YgiN
MTFMQIIEFRTSDIATMRDLDREWVQATEGKRTARRQIVTRDRNDPGRYLVMVFFDSYESAMENSALPETQASAAKYAAAVDGPPTFYDLDIIDEQPLS